MIRAVRCAPGRAGELMAGLEAPKFDSAAQFSLSALMAQPGAEVYGVEDEQGAIVAAYVLEPVGAVLWSTAFAGRASFDLTIVLDGLLMQQAREFDAVMFRTERRGLVRKACRLGWAVDRKKGGAYYMKKATK